MSKRRSLIKTCTWRLIASTDTFCIAWIASQYYNSPVALAGIIAGVEIINKFMLYYAHERIWANLRRKEIIK